MTDESRVPHRRDAGLAVGLIAADNQQFFDRPASDCGVLLVAKHIEHHRCIGHRRKDRPEPVFAIEPLGNKCGRSIDGALPQVSWKKFDGRPEYYVDAAKQHKPDPALMRSFCCRPDRKRWFDKQFVDLDAKWVLCARTQCLQNQQRYQHSARPVRHLRQMEWKPAWQQHYFDRHLRHATPVQNSIERQQYAGEHVGVHCAAARQNRLACAAHVGRLGAVPNHLERKIGFHARTHVEIALVVERPPTMRALDATQVDRYFLLEDFIDRFTAIVSQQHIFGWNRCISFKFENPMPVVLLGFEQRTYRTLSRLVEVERLLRRARFLYKRHAAAFNCWPARSAAR